MWYTFGQDFWFSAAYAVRSIWHIQSQLMFCHHPVKATQHCTKHDHPACWSSAHWASAWHRSQQSALACNYTDNLLTNLCSAFTLCLASEV